MGSLLALATAGARGLTPEQMSTAYETGYVPEATISVTETTGEVTTKTYPAMQYIGNIIGLPVWTWVLIGVGIVGLLIFLVGRKK